MIYGPFESYGALQKELEERGIEILSSDKKKIGIGLSSYSSEEGKKIMGHKSNEIGNILSYSYREEMIHKDDLVLL